MMSDTANKTATFIGGVVFRSEFIDSLINHLHRQGMLAQMELVTLTPSDFFAYELLKENGVNFNDRPRTSEPDEDDFGASP